MQHYPDRADSLLSYINRYIQASKIKHFFDRIGCGIVTNKDSKSTKCIGGRKLEKMSHAHINQNFGQL